jgi:hypothetical protein
VSKLNPQGFKILRIRLKPTPGEPILLLLLLYLKINIRTKGSLEKEEPTQCGVNLACYTTFFRSAAKVN